MNFSVRLFHILYYSKMNSINTSSSCYVKEIMCFFYKHFLFTSNIDPVYYK